MSKIHKKTVKRRQRNRQSVNKYSVLKGGYISNARKYPKLSTKLYSRSHKPKTIHSISTNYNSKSKLKSIKSKSSLLAPKIHLGAGKASIENRIIHI